MPAGFKSRTNNPSPIIGRGLHPALPALGTHYAVVGYDLARQEIVLRSGIEPRRITPFGVFLNTWDRSARWGIVVLAPGAFPAQAKPKPYLEAASALESLGRHQEAREAYKASTASWPDNPLVWLGLGNTEYALGHAEPAEAAFRHALHRQEGAAVVWNNLAYALATRQLHTPSPGSSTLPPRVSGLKIPNSRIP